MIQKRPLLRKIIVLSILAVAGIGVGEIYQYFSTQTVEEALVHYQAKQLMMQTMRINDVDVVGKVWRLPPGVSTQILAKAKGRALVVPQEGGHVVYSFDNDFQPTPSAQFYPAALPAIAGFNCEYTIAMTNTRSVVMGIANASCQAMEQQAATTLTNAGWHYRPETMTWQKDADSLHLHNECF
jgi:hypothetical protein